MWFRPALLVSVLVGLVARLVFVTTTSLPVALDAVVYRSLANNLANGNGYAQAIRAQPHKFAAVAGHPPLFSSVLAVFDLLGLQSFTEQRGLVPDWAADAPYTGADVRAEGLPATPGASIVQ